MSLPGHLEEELEDPKSPLCSPSPKGREHSMISSLMGGRVSRRENDETTQLTVYKIIEGLTVFPLLVSVVLHYSG